MDLQNLIMEGSRRIDERGRLAEVFPDLDMAVEALANPERVKHSVTLTPEEWKVFFLVDGRRSLTRDLPAGGQPRRAGHAADPPPPRDGEVRGLVPAAGTPRRRARPGPRRSRPRHAEHGGRQAGAAAPPPVSVEFQSGVHARRSSSDDTKEIVTPKAVPVHGNAPQVTVSRLVLVKDGGETSFPLTRDTYTSAATATTTS